MCTCDRLILDLFHLWSFALYVDLGINAATPDFFGVDAETLIIGPRHVSRPSWRTLRSSISARSRGFEFSCSPSYCGDEAQRFQKAMTATLSHGLVLRFVPRHDK